MKRKNQNQKNLAGVLRGQDRRGISPVLVIISLECFEERSTNMRPPSVCDARPRVPLLLENSVS